MARKAIAIVLGVVLVLAVAQGAGDGPCDLKNVVKGLWCETDGALLDAKDLVSDVVRHVCPDCGRSAAEAGKCPGCEVELEKKVSGKEVCPTCLEKPAACEICVKTCFRCGGCGDATATAGKCEGCGEERKEETVKALVTYRCAECGESSLAAGKCTTEECPNLDQPLVKACGKSGIFPHVGK